MAALVNRRPIADSRKYRTVRILALATLKILLRRKP